MRYGWLSTVAATALAVGVATVHAQAPDKEKLGPGAQGQSQAQPGVQGPSKRQPDSTAQKDLSAPRDGAGGQSTVPRAAGPGQSGESTDSDSAQSKDGAETSKQGEAGSQDPDKATKRSQGKEPSTDRGTTTTRKSDGDKQEGGRAGVGSEQPSGTAQKRDDSKDSQRAGQPERDGKGDRADSDSDSGTSIELSERQETSIRTTLERERNLNIATDVDFEISVGVTVPRSVQLATLPSSIVEIVPAYRGYRYVVVRDEIIIVHPRTYRIVALVPAEGVARAEVRSTSRARVELSAPQRARILALARGGCATTLEEPDFQITVGTQIPRRIELCPFEQTVIEEVEVVQPYRFVVVQNQVVLVDPSSYTIVEVIR